MNAEHKYALVDRLLKLRDDRGALAALRRGLGKREGSIEMYPYVVPFLPERRGKEWLYFTVASLFALHPRHDGHDRNLGSAIARLPRTDSLEKRFLWLLSSETEELPMRLKAIFSYLKSKEIPVNYHRLMGDLYGWDHPKRFVQLAWARSFYAAPDTAKSDENHDKE